jgi:hypothetical protein
MCGWENTMIKSVQRLWKNVGTALGWVGLAGILCTAVLWTYQLHTLPRSPDERIGRTYPRNIHGIVVYQTRSESSLLETIQYGSVGIFAVSLMMSLYYKNKWDAS